MASSSRAFSENNTLQNEAAPFVFRKKEDVSERSMSTLDHSSSNSLAFSFGNSNVRSTVNSPAPVVQPKLEINQPGDKYEQEADAMAEKVIRMPEVGTSHLSSGPSTLQRKCSHCEEEEKKKKIQRKETGGGEVQAGNNLSTYVNSISNSGAPLPKTERDFFEQRFGYDFSKVRIHTGEAAANSAASINARAYTSINNIVFGAGQYQPTSERGKRLLAHELTHVIQQQGTSNMGSAPSTIQRDSVGAHSSPQSSGIPLEKWSPDVEASYRKAGLRKEADAVRSCREWGVCQKVLTEKEAWIMYSAGRTAAGLEKAKGGAGIAAAGLVATAPAVDAGGAAAKTALERAALRWGTAEVLSGGAGVAAEGGTAAAAGGSIAIAAPVAMAVVIVVAVASLVAWGSFQAELQRQGYTILPNILGVCIANCHQPTAPKLPSFPSFPRTTWTPSPQEYQKLKDWVDPLPPTEPGKFPIPKPKPKKDEEEKGKCNYEWVEPKFGRYPCHSDFAKTFSGTRLEFRLTDPKGIFVDFDAVRDKIVYEVKTGYQWILNKNLSPKMQKRKAEVIDRFQEQAAWQMYVATRCGYTLEWYFNSKAVADFFQSLLEPAVKCKTYDCDKDSDHTW